MAEEIHEGWFSNEDGHELNVQHQGDWVFITEYIDGRAVSKYVFDIRKRSPEYIVEFIKNFGTF